MASPKCWRTALRWLWNLRKPSMLQKIVALVGVLIGGVISLILAVLLVASFMEPVTSQWVGVESIQGGLVTLLVYALALCWASGYTLLQMKKKKALDS